MSGMENLGGLGGGNYVTGAGAGSTNGNQSGDRVAENQNPSSPNINPQNPEAVMDFMNAAGAMNMAHVNVDKDMTSRIEGFMASFEGAVAQGLLAIEDEFGGAFSEADALALAGEMVFNQEQFEI